MKTTRVSANTNMLQYLCYIKLHADCLVQSASHGLPFSDKSYVGKLKTYSKKYHRKTVLVISALQIRSLWQQEKIIRSSGAPCSPPTPSPLLLSLMGHMICTKIKTLGRNCVRRCLDFSHNECIPESGESWWLDWLWYKQAWKTNSVKFCWRLGQLGKLVS